METTIALFVTYGNAKDKRWIDAHRFQSPPKQGEIWEVEEIERGLIRWYRLVARISEAGEPAYDAANGYPCERVDALAEIVGFDKALKLVKIDERQYKRNKELVAPVGRELGRDIYETIKENQE